MPLASTPVSTALRMPADAANAIDRPQVMLVAGFGQIAALQMDAQAGAEHRLLDVVRGQGVAGEQRVDVIPRESTDDTCRTLPVCTIAGPPTSKRLAPRLARSKQFLGNLPDGDALGLFGRDRAVHEFERRPFGRPLVRKDPHAGVPDDELGARHDLAHGHAAGPGADRVDGDRRSPFPDSSTSIQWPPSRTSVRWLVVL